MHTHSQNVYAKKQLDDVFDAMVQDKPFVEGVALVAAVIVGADIYYWRNREKEEEPQLQLLQPAQHIGTIDIADKKIGL